MRVFVLMLALVFILSGIAMAVPSGKTVDFEGGGAGKVVFDGTTHASKGAKCGDCHPGLFPMKKGGEKLTMAAMAEGKNCGACHNGTKAFKANDPANCAKCHKK